MIVLIPLGGRGQRFRQERYARPKALVPAGGRPVLFWLLRQLEKQAAAPAAEVYIAYSGEYNPFRLEDQVRHAFPRLSVHFWELQQATRGAAETVMMALRHMPIPHGPILCLDCDNFYTCNIMEMWRQRNAIFTVFDDNKDPVYSYVATDGHEVTRIVEKEKISNYACTGAYGFACSRALATACERIIQHNIRDKQEFYLSTVIQNMIRHKEAVFAHVPVSKDQYVCLGTPLQLRTFSTDARFYEQSNRYCFDLDNTLVTHPRVAGDYGTVRPIPHAIEFLRYLKARGNTIIIHTARRMRTHAGNQGRVMADVGDITLDTLRRLDIPFDEIYFGKPHADVYIDDKALNAYQDLEKGTGVYPSASSAPTRHFHQLCRGGSVQIYRKVGKDLSGEIFYYRHIPPEIRSMFPAMVNAHTGRREWFEIEKVKGVTASSLYLSQEMTTEQLARVLAALQRIHAATASPGGAGGMCSSGMYANYAAKLEARYASHDYSVFEGAEGVYEALRQQLRAYQEEDRGVLAVIHGDPVLTNVLITPTQEVKCIDMRGKVGATLTIMGDQMYDWAKVYQSLIGYDEIMHGIQLDGAYAASMLDAFETFVCRELSPEALQDLRLLTKSLLFTLLPLHADQPQKCQQYYRLLTASPFPRRRPFSLCAGKR